MKRIVNITTKNKSKLNKIFTDVNGAALTHTAMAYQLDDIIIQAESKINALLPKKNSAGARLHVISGGSATQTAYKYSRTVTAYTLERGAKSWFLVTDSVKRREIYPGHAGGERLELTPAQSELAVQRFKKHNFMTQEQEV